MKIRVALVFMALLTAGAMSGCAGSSSQEEMTASHMQFTVQNPDGSTDNIVIPNAITGSTTVKDVDAMMNQELNLRGLEVLQPQAFDSGVRSMLVLDEVTGLPKDGDYNCKPFKCGSHKEAQSEPDCHTGSQLSCVCYPCPPNITE